MTDHMKGFIFHLRITELIYPHFFTHPSIYVHAKAGACAGRGCYPFEIYTCGGVRCGERREQACYTPYTRNIAGHTRVNLSLRKGTQ